MARRTSQQILRDEQLDGLVSELFDRVDEVARDLAPSSQAVGSHEASDRRTPDFSELLRSDLKEYFEHEIVPAIPNPAGDGFIDETELRQEVAKKALIGLKLSQLRHGAEVIDASLVGARSAEEVAAAVAKALHWDPEAVAQFVLDNEEEPTDNNAHGVRLYSLSKNTASLDAVEADVRQMMGHYIRVGIARWYVFGDVSRTDDGIRLFGKFMSWAVDVNTASQAAALTSVATRQDVEALVAPARQVVEVSNVAIRAARAAVFAATSLLGQETLGFVPNAGSDADQIRGKVHGSTEFLLSILQNRLRGSGILSIDPTVARFKYDSVSDDSANDRKPRLRAVRFDGNHILDSVPACRFIIEEGRPLANIAFRLLIGYADSAGAIRKGSFPVKIAIESDHVQVVTGLGDDPLGSKRVHELVKSAVCAEMTDGRPTNSTLDELLKRMTERARALEPSETASVLSPRDDNETGASNGVLEDTAEN